MFEKFSLEVFRYLPFNSSLFEKAIECKIKSIVPHLSSMSLKESFIEPSFKTSHSIKKSLLIESANGFTLLSKDSPW